MTTQLTAEVWNSGTQIIYAGPEWAIQCTVSIHRGDDGMVRIGQMTRGALGEPVYTMSYIR